LQIAQTLSQDASNDQLATILKDGETRAIGILIEYYMKDFEMKASSRVSNTYIMALTGLIALMLIITVIFVKRR